MNEITGWHQVVRIKADALIRRLAEVQERKPWLVLLLVALVTGPSAYLATQLDLKTDFAELLPENKPSVLEMHRVQQYMPSASTISIVARSQDKEALKTFVDRVTPRLMALGPEWVTQIDSGVRDLQAFIEQNKLLFAPYDDLEQIHGEVFARYQYEVARAMDLLETEEGDETGDDAPTDEFDEAAAAKQREERKKAEASDEPTDEFDQAAAAKQPPPAPAPPPAGGTAAPEDAAAAGKAAPKGPPPSLNELRRRVDDLVTREKRRDPHPEGYYLAKDGKTIVILVRTPSAVGSLSRFPLMMDRIRAVVAEVNPTSLVADMTVGYTGDFISGNEEYKSIRDDLLQVGVAGIAMVLGSVFLFFLHFRTLIALSLSILVGILWTFGLARVTPGYLNTSTGFLVSIIAGNGINFGIIYMARYIEARRARIATGAALLLAHRDTWLATLAASSAAICAYGSLAITDFKGFKHFGIIGGGGMLLCWLATYLTLPAILAISERLMPAVTERVTWRDRAQALFGLPFAWLSARIPRLLLVIAVVSGIASMVITYLYVARDPTEYNLRKMRNVPKVESEAKKLSGEVDDIVGKVGQEGMALLVDRLDQVAPLKVALEAKRDAVPFDERPFDRVVSMFDLLPDRQEEKIRLIKEVEGKLRSAYQRKYVSEEDWKQIEELLPRRELVPLTIADLPEMMARPFREKDGTLGRIVYIVPRSDRSVWNAHYIHTWADSFRRTTLPNGEVILGSGRAVIFSDMLRAVNEDAPKAIIASIIGTFLVILVAFRMRRIALAAISALALGCFWLVAFFFFKDIKVNFLNFIAFPIAIGISADYSINMLRRFQIEGLGRLRRIVVETGGAVVLCSLTTMLGYIALMFSTNQAIVSFGLASAVAEVVTVIAAVLIIPAGLYWLARRRGVAQEEGSSSAGAPPS